MNDLEARNLSEEDRKGDFKVATLLNQIENLGVKESPNRIEFHNLISKLKKYKKNIFSV